MSKPNPWPLKANEDLNKIIDQLGLIDSISVVALRELQDRNVGLIQDLLKPLSKAIKRCQILIDGIQDHLPGPKGGSPRKWMRVKEKIASLIAEMEQDRMDCLLQYKDGNWKCVKMYFEDLQVISALIISDIKSVPRASAPEREQKDNPIPDAFREAFENDNH